MLRVRSTTVLRLALGIVVLLVGMGSTASAAEPDLGPNVTTFDPSMPVGEIQAAVDAIHAR
jgi:hypothetical protein